MTEPKDQALGLMKLKDPNEALGLAIRLLAGESPFRDMPLGFSVAGLVGSIDAGDYIFVRRGERAVGVAHWMYVKPETGEAWLGEGASFVEEERLKSSPAVIIMALQAIDASVTRFLFNGLRDVCLADCQLCYFLRDYGKDKGGMRGVRMVMPKVRRKRVTESTS